MDIGQSFSYIFEDQDWVKKLVIGSVLVLLSFLTIGLAAIPLAGWQLETTRRVIRGTQPTLPEWSDLGGLIRDGLKVVAGGFLWALPIILVGVCRNLLGGPLSSQVSEDATVLILSLLILCLLVPYSFLLALLFPAFLGQLADHGELGRALNPISAVKLVRSNPSGYGVAVLLALFVAPFIQSIGSLVCVVGLLPAAAYTTALLGHINGKAYREATAAVPGESAPAA